MERPVLPSTKTPWFRYPEDLDPVLRDIRDNLDVLDSDVDDIQSGALPIALPGIEGALEGYASLQGMPLVLTKNYQRSLSRFDSFAAAVDDLPDGGANGGEIRVDGEVSWSGSQTLPAKIHLVGRGNRSTVLKLAPSPTVPALILDGSSDAMIADLAIVLPSGSNASSGGYGITIKGACENVLIERVYTDRLVRGINAEGWAGTTQGTVERLTIRDCQCDNSPTNYGINLDDVDGALIENCAGYGNWLDGMKLRRKARNVTVLGGRYNNNGVSGAGDGIDIYAGGSKYSMIGVECSGNDGSGITIKTGDLQKTDAATYGYVQDIAVSGCRFLDNTGMGVYLTVSDPLDTTEPVVGLVSLSSCMAIGNGSDGFYLNARNVTAHGLLSKRNDRNGYTVAARAMDTKLIGCVAIANGDPAGYGFDIQGTRGSLSACMALGKDADTVAVDGDYSALTSTHLYGFKFSSNAVGPWFIDEACASLHHTAGSMTGVFVDASSGVFVAHQAGTLTPNTHGIYGSLGSTYRKTNAAAAADVLWCKTSGAPNAITGWTQVTP